MGVGGPRSPTSGRQGPSEVPLPGPDNLRCVTPPRLGSNWNSGSRGSRQNPCRPWNSLSRPETEQYLTQGIRTSRVFDSDTGPECGRRSEMRLGREPTRTSPTPHWHRTPYTVPRCSSLSLSIFSSSRLTTELTETSPTHPDRPCSTPPDPNKNRPAPTPVPHLLPLAPTSPRRRE